MPWWLYRYVKNRLRLRWKLTRRVGIFFEKRFCGHLARSVWPYGTGRQYRLGKSCTWLCVQLYRVFHSSKRWYFFFNFLCVSGCIQKQNKTNQTRLLLRTFLTVNVCVCGFGLRDWRIEIGKGVWIIVSFSEKLEPYGIVFVAGSRPTLRSTRLKMQEIR